MAPAVTVVIPSRDRPTLVRRAATCALGQVGVDVDVIVVDDGSQRPLVDELDDLVTRSNGRLQVVRTPSSEGVAAARNRGVREARGEWVGFCDDDDFWAPTKARAQVCVPSAAQATWTCSGAMAMGPDLDFHFAMIGPSGPDTYEALLSGNVIPAGRVLGDRPHRRPCSRPAGSTRPSPRWRTGTCGSGSRRPVRSTRCTTPWSPTWSTPRACPATPTGSKPT